MFHLFHLFVLAVPVVSIFLKNCPNKTFNYFQMYITISEKNIWT
jgi:hypothetical protein